MAAINGLWSPVMAGWRIMLDMRGESNPNCLFPREYFHPGSREDRGSGMLQLMITQSRGIRFDLGNWEKRKLSVATSLQPALATAIWSKAHVWHQSLSWEDSAFLSFGFDFRDSWHLSHMPLTPIPHVTKRNTFLNPFIFMHMCMKHTYVCVKNNSIRPESKF